jgi:hypothetical protein
VQTANSHFPVSAPIDTGTGTGHFHICTLAAPAAQPRAARRATSPRSGPTSCRRRATSPRQRPNLAPLGGQPRPPPGGPNLAACSAARATGRRRA